MLWIKRYEHTYTNHEKTEMTARRQPKNVDKTVIFAKEKPKPNTFVFDLGFAWRKRWDSNPRTSYPVTAFRVRAVMTTSIHFHLIIMFVRVALTRVQHILLGYYSTLFGILQQILSRCFKVAVFRGVSCLILSLIRIIIIT